MNTALTPSRRRVWIIATVAMVVLMVGLIAGKIGFEATRPVSIQPLSAIPAKWNVPVGKKIEDLSEYFVEYKLVGQLPGKPNDQFHLVVHGPEATPYMRILYGDDLEKGGIVGLAVRKRGVKYTAALRGYNYQGNGPRYSNTLTFTY
ncbi:hypothetical protein NA78x_003481 [Anatilimnocola sp. NA78]|uniref:hypothetical protein n=1 Tax=Anatilimnocola sp. NA78 TaxID=3415683 RepID=UPI003CE57EBF